MTLAEMRDILSRIEYRDWQFVITDLEPRTLHVLFRADGESWTGRKWPVSQHMTESELVQTALKAVLTAEEHEAREHFTYCGRAIFGPHLDVHALIDVVDRKLLDARAPRPSELDDVSDRVHGREDLVDVRV